ncbi:triacylglycerol lipase [Salinibacterium sp. ZJ450]|uniref:esterase/lipase family protein n=1 Tax=Salinibacterium sp. ZJ450 TaxID=2708338 RepID=UPI00141F83B1|nr:alpha/beta hydrolase [Salinibacterium sp. ZJ450]
MTALVVTALDWARDYAYAAGWQLRHALRRRGADTLASGSAAPVLLIPGVWETWQFLRPVAERLNEAGHPIHVVDDLGYNRGGVREMAAITERYLQRHDLQGVIIVAHSKGGLIGKHVMLGASGDRIRRMIAIATPFAGSVYANYLPVRTLRAFRPSDKTILLLGEGIAANKRIVSIYPKFDPHIPAGSFLAGARNIELPVAGHFRILSDPRLLRAVLTNLEG